MLKDIFFALWFFLPAGIANMVPVFAAHLPGLKNLDTPMDFGKNFRGKRIFGEHKTWRGLVVGIIAATFTLWVQQVLVAHFAWARSLTSDVNYMSLPTLIVGPLFAIGALGGDAVESFFKRQRNVPPGHGWFPFDQTDYIIGASIVTMPFISLSLLQYAWLLVLWVLAHIAATIIGYFLGLKDRPI